MIDNDGLWWISVGGNKCEPARVEHGIVFTIGCQDGTEWTNDCGIELVERITDIPDTPKEKLRKRRIWEKQREQDEKRGIHHGYRRFE